MALYTIPLERKTVHGVFSRDLPPILEIDPGDSICFSTLTDGWLLHPPPDSGSYTTHFARNKEETELNGHALCGPIAIRGAQPGMALEVHIDEVKVGSWGHSGAGGGSELSRRLGLAPGDRASMRWELDAEAMIGRSQHGQTVALRPFMGVMGLPPDLPGAHDTGPPRFCGGNLDCKELVAGTTLFLPITLPGALFSAGDGHAAQGDGEVSGGAIECPLDQVRLTLRLRPELRLSTPRARTASGWLTLGLHEDLDEAAVLALSAMLDLMQEQYHLQRAAALSLASLVVDLRITQIVDGVRGVHAFLPHGAIGG
jgi:acetamidase/formamidase